MAWEIGYLEQIDAPAATGKSKRNKMFLISESDKEMVKSCFDTRL